MKITCVDNSYESWGVFGASLSMNQIKDDTIHSKLIFLITLGLQTFNSLRSLNICVDTIQNSEILNVFQSQ